MKKYVLGTVFLGGLLAFFACSDIGITSPPGPAGPAGQSTYALWLEQIENKTIEWTGGTSEADFFKYLKGEQGASAYEAWVKYISTGQVDNPHDPTVKWPAADNKESDFYYFLTGADGATPFINEDGFWQIGEEVTEYLAAGQPGEKGEPGEPGTPGDRVTIDPTTGNWFINNEDTHVSATGAQGVAGPAGKSTYQMWLDELGVDIYEPDGTTLWPTDDEYIDLDHFWYYVRGLNSEGEGVTPGVMELTLLEFVSSVRDTQDETKAIFTFHTDPGAKVTMNYQEMTVSGTADDQGMCEIRFTNSDTREYYALAYANIDGKDRSNPVQVRVPIRASGYELILDWPNAVWCEAGVVGFTPVDNSDGSYGNINSDAPYTPQNPFIWFMRNKPSKLYVPFYTENIAYLKVSFVTGGSQFNTGIVTAPPYGDYDYTTGTFTRGVIWMSPIGGIKPILNTTYEVVAYTNQDRPIITLNFRATNR